MRRTPRYLALALLLAALGSPGLGCQPAQDKPQDKPAQDKPQEAPDQGEPTQEPAQEAPEPGEPTQEQAAPQAGLGDLKPELEPLALEILRHELARDVGSQDKGPLAHWQHPEAQIRARVARSLGRIGEPSGLEPLASLARGDESPVVRREAAAGLGLLAATLTPEEAPLLAEARDALLAAWEEEGKRPQPDAATRQALVWSMRKVGGKDAKGLIKVLTQAATELDQDVARQALLSLALLARFSPQTPDATGEEVRKAMLQRTGDTDAQLREAALYGLMRLKDPGGLEALKAAAMTPGHEPSRRVAVRGLTALEDKDVSVARALLLPPPESTEENPEPPDLRGDTLTKIEVLRHLGQIGDEAALVAADAFLREILPVMAEHGTGLAGPRFHLLMTYVQTLPSYKDKERARKMLLSLYEAAGTNGGLRRGEAALSEDINAALLHCASADALDRMDGAVTRLPTCAQGLERAYDPQRRQSMVVSATVATAKKPEVAAQYLAGAYKEAPAKVKATLLAEAVQLAQSARPKPAKEGAQPGPLPAPLVKALAPLATQAAAEEDKVLATYAISLRVELGEPGLEKALEERLALFQPEQPPGENLDIILELLDGLRKRKAGAELLKRWTANPHAAVRRRALQSLAQVDPASGPAPWRPVFPEVDRAWVQPQPQEALLRTTRGNIRVALMPQVAPATVANFLKIAQAGTYNKVPFHRVIANFVSQGGDPRGDGHGGPGWTIPSEWSLEPYGPGTLGMAHAGKDTGGSQFFFTHTDHPHLVGGYTVFGRVLDGLEVVRSIQEGDRILGVEIKPPAPASP